MKKPNLIKFITKKCREEGKILPDVFRPRFRRVRMKENCNDSQEKKFKFTEVVKLYVQWRALKCWKNEIFLNLYRMYKKMNITLAPVSFTRISFYCINIICIVNDEKSLQIHYEATLERAGVKNIQICRGFFFRLKTIRSLYANFQYHGEIDKREEGIFPMS